MTHSMQPDSTSKWRPAAGLPDGVHAVNSKLLYASNAMSDLIMTGVLQRYPRLKLVLVENEVGWTSFDLGAV